MSRMSSSAEISLPCSKADGILVETTREKSGWGRWACRRVIRWDELPHRLLVLAAVSTSMSASVALSGSLWLVSEVWLEEMGWNVWALRFWSLWSGCQIKCRRLWRHWRAWSTWSADERGAGQHQRKFYELIEHTADWTAEERNPQMEKWLNWL